MNAKGCYRYYSTQRPIGIGCYPKPVGNKVLNIENFDERKKVPEISRKAWGYIEYEYPVDEDQLRAYELVKPEKLYMDRSTKGSRAVSWENLERVKMGILCEAVALVLSGKLDQLEDEGK